MSTVYKDFKTLQVAVPIFTKYAIRWCPLRTFATSHLGSPDTLIGSLILRLDIQTHGTVLVPFHQPRFLEKKNHHNLRREPYCTLAVWQVGQLWNGSLHEFWKFHELCNFRSNILYDLKFFALKRLDFIICEVFPFNSHSRTNTWLQVSLEEANSNFSRQVAHCQLGYRHKILPALHTKDQCTLWSSIISISETYPTKLYSISRKIFFHNSEKSFSQFGFKSIISQRKKTLQKHQTIESNTSRAIGCSAEPRGHLGGKQWNFRTAGTGCNFRW